MNAEAEQSQSFRPAIDDYVEQQMRRLRIPGVAVAIVEGDRIVYTRGYGRCPRHGSPDGGPPGPQTPFVLGSTTKSITAVAVMQLVEAGKVRLDEPIQRYLPWFRVADLLASAQITVRHLLNQTSALPMISGMTPLADLSQDPGAAERQARGLATVELSRSPGAAWEYSNLNYLLLGLVVEAASGERYPDYVRRHIFDPLGMDHSYTSLEPAKRDALAVGHRYWFSYPVPAADLPLPLGLQAGGGLISCAEDMARYLIAMLNGGRGGQAQILSPAGVATLQRGAADYGAMGKTLGQYAMGWFVDDVDGTRLVYHEGNVPEYSSFMALLPGTNRGIILLFNSHLYGLPMVVAEVGKGAALLLAGQPPASQPGFGAVIPRAARGLALIPVLQIAAVALTLRAVPAGGRRRALARLPLLLPNLALAALPVFLRRKRLAGYLSLFNPDVAWLTRICGALAVAWMVVQGAAILRRPR